MSMVSMETKTEFDKSAIQTQQKLFSSINFSIIFKIKSANFPIVNYFRQYTIMVLEYLLYTGGGSMSQVAGYTSLSPIRRVFAPGFVNLPMFGGSLQLPPPLKLVAMTIAEILLKVALKHQKSNHLLYNSSTFCTTGYTFIVHRGPGWLNELGRWIYKPITNTACVRPRLCKFAHGWWFSPASTTKTGHHDNS